MPLAPRSASISASRKQPKCRPRSDAADMIVLGHSTLEISRFLDGTSSAEPLVAQLSAPASPACSAGAIAAKTSA
jgi:hypothetical protein